MSKYDEAAKRVITGNFNIGEETKNVILYALKTANKRLRNDRSTEWIPVKSKTPPLGKRVLMYSNQGEYYIGSLVRFFGRPGSPDNIYKWSHRKIPVAWMPLPEPYKEGEQNG